MQPGVYGPQPGFPLQQHPGHPSQGGHGPGNTGAPQGGLASSQQGLQGSSEQTDQNLTMFGPQTSSVEQLQDLASAAGSGPPPSFTNHIKGGGAPRSDVSVAYQESRDRREATRKRNRRDIRQGKGKG